jgi:hypothetical protein
MRKGSGGDVTILGLYILDSERALRLSKPQRRRLGPKWPEFAVVLHCCCLLLSLLRFLFLCHCCCCV